MATCSFCTLTRILGGKQCVITCLNSQGHLRDQGSFIIGNFKPDITFLSTVNVKNLKSRLNKRLNLNRYDKFKLNFYNKVQKGYYKISKNNKNYMIIDSNKKSIKEVKKFIISKLEKII